MAVLLSWRLAGLHLPVNKPSLHRDKDRKECGPLEMKATGTPGVQPVGASKQTLLLA